MPIYLIDKIKAKNAGTFPMLDDVDLYGGWRTVADLAARDAIPAEKRAEGMQVKVISEDKTYELKGGITNGDWSEATGAVEGALLATVEDLTIPVDYNGASVGDPTGVLFQKQSDVDDYLTAQGWTAFKHLEAAYEALPSRVAHEVVFNLAAGEHRSRGVGASFGHNLDSKYVESTGTIKVLGVSSSSWDLSDPSLTGLSIVAHQVGSGDPWVQFAGTPFNGFDLKGQFALLSTGQLCVIHDHTDDTLFLMAGLSPDPTGATVSVRVPATVISNRLSGGGQAASGMMNVNSQNTGITFYKGNIDFEDIGFNVEDVPGNCIQITQYAELHRTRTYGANANANIFIGSVISVVLCYDSSIYVPTPGWSPFLLRGNGNSFFVTNKSYFRGPTTQETYFENMKVSWYDSVVDGGGNGNDYGSLTMIKVYVDFFQSLGGKFNEIRNSGGQGVPCALYLGKNTEVRESSQRLRFKNCTVPCIRVAQTVLDITSCSGNQGFFDGGGNTDVGIELIGPQAFFRINEETNVTGTLGDVRLQGGDIVSYTDIEASPGGVIDEGFNRIEVA